MKVSKMKPRVRNFRIGQTVHDWERPEFVGMLIAINGTRHGVVRLEDKSKVHVSMRNLRLGRPKPGHKPPPRYTQSATVEQIKAAKAAGLPVAEYLSALRAKNKGTNPTAVQVREAKLAGMSVVDYMREVRLGRKPPRLERKISSQLFDVTRVIRCCDCGGKANPSTRDAKRCMVCAEKVRQRRSVAASGVRAAA